MMTNMETSEIAVGKMGRKKLGPPGHRNTARVHRRRNAVVRIMDRQVSRPHRETQPPRLSSRILTRNGLAMCLLRCQ